MAQSSCFKWVSKKNVFSVNVWPFRHYNIYVFQPGCATQRWPIIHQDHTQVGSSPECIDEGKTHMTYDLIYIGENGYFMMMFLRCKYKWRCSSQPTQLLHGMYFLAGNQGVYWEWLSLNFFRLGRGTGLRFGINVRYTLGYE